MSSSSGSMCWKTWCGYVGERLPSRKHNKQLLPSYETELCCSFCMRQGGRTAYRQFASTDSLKTHRFHRAALHPIRSTCPYPLCAKVLDGVEHFKNHIAMVHGVNLIDHKYTRAPTLASFPNTAALLKPARPTALSQQSLRQSPSGQVQVPSAPVMARARDRPGTGLGHVCVQSLGLDLRDCCCMRP